MSIRKYAILVLSLVALQTASTLEPTMPNGTYTGVGHFYLPDLSGISAIKWEARMTIKGEALTIERKGRVLLELAWNSESGYWEKVSKKPDVKIICRGSEIGGIWVVDSTMHEKDVRKSSLRLYLTRAVEVDQKSEVKQ